MSTTLTTTNNVAIAELEAAIRSAMIEIESVRNSPPAVKLFTGQQVDSIDYDLIQQRCQFVADKINTLRAAKEGREIRFEAGLGWVIA